MFSYNTAKDELNASRTFDLTVKHPAQICAQSVAISSNGNLMINLRWEIMSGVDAGKKVFDRVTLSGNALDRLDSFAAAIGKDLATEWGGQTVDEAFLTGWAETLLGEMALLELKAKKTTAEYPTPGIDVKSYAPLSTAQNAVTAIDLD
jgi:hypothetical protein